MWELPLVGALIALSFLLYKIKGPYQSKVVFSYAMPILKPVAIPTKGKGFWTAIRIWLFTTREWVVVQDWIFTLDGRNYKIPKGFQFDGASVPKFMRMWLSPTGILLIGGLVHDYGYKHGTLLMVGDHEIGQKDQKWMDQLFLDVCVAVNGFSTLNYIAYCMLRCFGFIAWNKHRRENGPSNA